MGHVLVISWDSTLVAQYTASADEAQTTQKVQEIRSAPCGAAPLKPLSPARPRKRGQGGSGSGVPVEGLLLALRALAQLDVDEAGARRLHQLVERVTHIVNVLDIGAEAAEGFHHLVVAGA